MIARICIRLLEGASGSAWSLLAISWLVPWRGSGYAGASRGIPLGISVTDLEIEEAIREAWAVLSTGSAVLPSTRRLAAALLAVTGGTPTHPKWVTPDDLWRDRLAVLAEQNAWLAAWGPRPGEPDCRVPPALLPESQTRRENAYLLWRSTVRVSTDADNESRTVAKPRSRRRDDPKNPLLPAREPDGTNQRAPDSNPVAARTECSPRTCMAAPRSSHYSHSSGPDPAQTEETGLDEAAVVARAPPCSGRRVER